MSKRPLCMALIVWIVFILLFRAYWQEEPRQRAGENLTMTGQVEDITGMDEKTSLIVKNVTDGKGRICKRMKVWMGKNKKLFHSLRIGQIIRVQGSVYSFLEPGNPGQFNEFQYYQQQGIQYKALADNVSVINQSYKKLREYLRQLRMRLIRSLNVCCGERDAGILAAMVAGEKGGMDEEIKKLYQENGIAHILAISGLHISLLGAGLFYLLRKYIMPMQAAALVSGILLILYGIFTGFSVSTVRAVIMMLCMLGARLCGRCYDALCALALSAWLQLLLQPLALFQTGFILSYGTVFGILIFGRVFTEQWQDTKGCALFAGSLGVQLITMPILLATYYELPLYGLFANLILLPFLGMLLCSGLAGGVIALYSVAIGRFCLGITHYILFFYESICYILKCLPCHTLILGRPSNLQILIYYILLGAWLLIHKKCSAHWHYLIFVFAVGILCYCPSAKVSGLEMTNLDVGQGDCTCIRTDDKTVLVDGGSSDVDKAGKYRIAPFLKYKGIRTIDYLFVTHSDGDHTNGLLEIIEDSAHMGFTIGKVVLPRIHKKDDNYIQFEKRCRRAGVSLLYMEKGDSLSIGEIKMTCFHPFYEYDWKSENDYSLVLELKFGRFRGLLTGDLEEEGEEAIAELLRPVQYLKAGHHGSKSSSSESFLQKLCPRIAVYSAGRNNCYGHPAQETKQRMEKAGAEQLCTFRQGAVRICSDGTDYSVSTFCGTED